jgi:hypothetical protein
LTANRRARRRAGNHEREAARAWHPPPPANKIEGSGDSAFSALGFGDVFSSFDGNAALSRYSDGDTAGPLIWLDGSGNSKGDYRGSISSSSAGDGSQDEDFDPGFCSSNGAGRLDDTKSGASSSDDVAAALRKDAEHLAGANTERAQADAEEVAKHQAAAAVNNAKQREAAAGARELKEATAAKRADDAVAMREVRLKADRERYSLTAPNVKQAPHLASTAAPRSSGPAKPSAASCVGTGYDDGHAHENGSYGAYAHGRSGSS